jgi:hypoxanthine phosphoribosyltransferase
MSEALHTTGERLEIIFSADEVNRRIDEMGAELIEKYKEADPIYVCLLHGGMLFTSKLMESATRQDPTFHPKVTTMIISRYGPNREPGQTRIVAPIPHDFLEILPGREVIILDDLIDKGGTMSFAREYALDQGAARVGGIVLGRKLQHPQVDVPVDHIGFDNLPNEWLLGMGMNGEEEAYRWAGYIAILKNPEERNS